MSTSGLRVGGIIGFFVIRHLKEYYKTSCLFIRSLQRSKRPQDLVRLAKNPCALRGEVPDIGTQKPWAFLIFWRADIKEGYVTSSLKHEYLEWQQRIAIDFRSLVCDCCKLKALYFFWQFM